ncbi:MAG: hypothetical protein JST47_10855 [Bacteroidetes bacterium]|nr:hypothetical protein [Bacteroidota bacterium]MBS1975275.1 hypothetical protein [Bacteroidota bacterium]
MSPAIRKIVLSLLVISSCALLNNAHAQLSAAQKKELRKREDSLKEFANNIVWGQETAERFRADSNFIRMLVRALVLKNSFYYPFDSLKTISRLYSPDSVFRIFTWQLKKDAYSYFQRGAIQVRTTDGSLKLIPLHDESNFTNSPDDSVRAPNNWIGAIYYRIVLKTFQGKKFYTLLGYDDFAFTSTKKWMEVLTFDDEGRPLFGGPYIYIKDDTTGRQVRYRFHIEYKKDAAATLNYDPDMDMIVYNDLISETNEPKMKDTYVPDGDFQGFKWENGQWVHVDKVFHTNMKDGEFPKEHLILDDNGKPNEQKLIDQSIINMQKKDSSNKKPVKKVRD